MAIFEFIEGWYKPYRRHSVSATSHPSTSKGTTHRLFESQTYRPSTEPGGLHLGAEPGENERKVTDLVKRGLERIV
jgi:hypothetical protein